MSSYFDLSDVPIFLNFLNRESWETENVQFNDDEFQSILSVAILSTNSFVYVGHAIVIEDMLKYPKTIKLLMNLEKYGYVCLVGNDFNINNFITRRRELYRHDRKKYKIYFQDNIGVLPWPRKPIITNTDTTAILSTTLIKLANDIQDEKEYHWTNLNNRDKNWLGKRMDYQKRSKIAITKKLLKNSLISNNGKATIRRLIIQIYNRRYCDEFCGVCLTGIPGLMYYDRFQNTELYYNYLILREVFRALNILSEEFICNNDKLLCIREDANFKILLHEVKKFLAGITAMKNSISNVIIFIRNNLSDHFNRDDDCDELVIKLWLISSKLCNMYTDFVKGYEGMAYNYKKVLIISASVLEYRVLRECAKKRNYMFVDKDTTTDDLSYAECIEKNGIKIFLARTDMGALNAAHALELLNRYINPDFVMIGGICVGLRKKEQKLTQLLISKQIHDYDLRKVTYSKQILRGTTIPANRYLYDKCILECYDMNVDDYDDGLILSANVLVNDKNFVMKMVDDKPDAIGYEMEGAGVSYMCNIFNNRWIMVKSISDWGFNKQNDIQEEAAIKSYNFIFNVIQNRIKL